MSQTHIVVATPMYGGLCSGYYMQSTVALPALAQAQGFGLQFSLMFNESLIQRARNALANGFLKNKDATHLMFIDADIRFTAQDVFSMLAQDKDVICGLYPKKEINWWMVHRAATELGKPFKELHHYTGNMVVNLPGNPGQLSVRRDEPFEIEAGGTGFMLIKREVFERLEVPTYTNDVLDLSGQMGADEVREFFPVVIDHASHRLLSEDYAFCKLVREAGMKVWAAPWVELGHFGSYLFSGGLIPGDLTTG